MIPADLLDEWTKTTERRDALDCLDVLSLLVDDVTKYEKAHGRIVRDESSDEFDHMFDANRALGVIETFIRKHT